MLEVVVSDRVHRVVLWQGLLVAIYDGSPPAESFERQRQFVREHIAAGRGKLARLVVMSARTPLPEPAMRRGIEALVKEMAPACSGAALVQEGEGFLVAAVRAVVTGVNLVVRQPYPIKNFASVPQAAAWLATRTGLDALDVERVAAEVRSELAPGPRAEAR